MPILGGSEVSNLLIDISITLYAAASVLPLCVFFFFFFSIGGCVEIRFVYDSQELRLR